MATNVMLEDVIAYTDLIPCRYSNGMKRPNDTSSRSFKTRWSTDAIHIKYPVVRVEGIKIRISANV